MTLAEARNTRLDALSRRVDLAPLAGRHLFLTGCTGFVGGWLLSVLATLNRRGAGIHATLLSRSPDAFRARQPGLSSAAWLTVVAGDVTDGMPRLAYPINGVIHGASSVTPSSAADADALKTLVVGTQHVLDWARQQGVGKIVCLSSGAVYGPMPADIHAAAETQPCQLAPNDAYACGKLAMEAQTLACGRAGGPAAVIARLFTFAGPGLAPHLALPQFMDMAARGHPITLTSDGSPIRSYLYGGDMAVWLLSLLAHAPNGTICNVGADTPITLAELANHIDQRYGQGRGVTLGTASGGTRCRYLPDITLARQGFGLDAWTPLGDALNEQSAWLTQGPDGRAS
jgi:nucleoside-diphosphate-sugar epimerase